MVLFSVVVLFLCAGILTPKEMLEGFSNKGMMTVAMLFMVSEGIRPVSYTHLKPSSPSADV